MCKCRSLIDSRKEGKDIFKNEREIIIAKMLCVVGGREIGRDRVRLV